MTNRRQVAETMVLSLALATCWGRSLPGQAAAPAGPEVVAPGTATAVAAEELVQEVRIVGNQAHGESWILSRMKTRAGRPFDQDVLSEDVRSLLASKKFSRVTPRIMRQGNPPAVTVIVEVDEHPVLRYIRFLGNTKFGDHALYKKSGLKKNEGLDPYAIEDARQRIEEHYREKGYSKAKVTIFEGNKPGDRGAAFLITEGETQRIRWVSFEGNSIVSEARLKTVIQSKPGFLWLLKGFVSRQKIEEDVDRLTAYYRDLGFFRAEVGRELLWDSENKWLHLKFVINEGPRYQVRNVQFIGNKKFSSDQFAAGLKLTAGKDFNKQDLDADLAAMGDFFGGRGYIFHEIQPETRFLDEPGQLDLIYRITEGDRWRVDRVNVRIAGDNPHTRQTTVLNRLSIRPGDVVDTRELRASERRLMASQLFEMDRAKGTAPKVVYGKPDLEDIDAAEVADRPPPGRPYRGQSPDGQPPAARPASWWPWWPRPQPQPAPQGRP
jgi:outer membrane protein insertion porin family